MNIEFWLVLVASYRVKSPYVLVQQVPTPEFGGRIARAIHLQLIKDQDCCNVNYEVLEHAPNA